MFIMRSEIDYFVYHEQALDIENERNTIKSI